MLSLKLLSAFVIVASYPFGLTPKYPLSLYTGMPFLERSILLSWVLAVVTAYDLIIGITLSSVRMWAL